MTVTIATTRTDYWDIDPAIKAVIDAGPSPVELAYLFLERLKENPEIVRMEDWVTPRSYFDGTPEPEEFTTLDVCGTTACMSGWGLHDAGLDVFWSPDEGPLVSAGGRSFSSRFTTFGAYAFGFDYGEADEMFNLDDDEIEEAVREHFGQDLINFTEAKRKVDQLEFERAVNDAEFWETSAGNWEKIARASASGHDYLTEQLKKAQIKAEAADFIVSILVDTEEWDSGTIERVYDALTARGLISTDDDGFACRVQ